MRHASTAKRSLIHIAAGGHPRTAAARVPRRRLSRVADRTRALRVAIAVAAGLGGAAVAAASASAAATVNHFSKVQHFDAGCGLPGATEYATGTEHLNVRDLDNGTLHVTYGETFKILQVSDDPTVAPRERQGTDAITFHLINNGPTVFHESYRERNTDFGDIFFFTTFVAVHGEVRVDRTFARNPPPPGC